MFDEEIILHNAAIFLKKIRSNPVIYGEVKEIYDYINSFYAFPAPVRALAEDLKNEKVETLAVILHQNGVSVDEKI